MFAITDPQMRKQGVSAFLVPTDTLGYYVEKIEHKLGQVDPYTCNIRFDDMVVPDELVLGDLYNRYRITLANLETGRIGTAAQSVSMTQATLGIAVGYAKERRSMDCFADTGMTFRGATRFRGVAGWQIDTCRNLSRLSRVRPKGLHGRCV